MSVLNDPGCVVAMGNTGLPDCPVTPDKIIGAILIDKSYVFESADVASASAFLTKLKSLTLLSGKNRAFPIFRFEELTDNTEDETVATLGYGAKQVVKDGKYDWTFRITAGGLCLHNNLRTFNKADKKVLFVDDSGMIYGTNGSSGFTGFSMDFFYAKPFKLNDGSNPPIFNVRFALSKPKEFNEDAAYIKMAVDVEENVKGISDVNISEVSLLAGTANVAVKTACDKLNLFDTYADDLADPALWIVKDSSGDAVSVTGVVKVLASEAWAVSFTGTGEHTIQLATPSDLADAGVGGAPANGFESDVLTVTMPETTPTPTPTA